MAIIQYEKCTLGGYVALLRVYYIVMIIVTIRRCLYELFIIITDQLF